MKEKKILIVGCGGLGCELVKLLSAMNFEKLTLIDLDVVEFSNATRSYIFRSTDVKKFKAEVLAKNFAKLNNTTNIEWKTEDIRNFDIEFFKGFNFVFTCLDSNRTRSYVNLRCIYAKVPFVDGSSVGWLGRTLYFSNKAECFDCVKRETFQNIPLRTIKCFPTEFKHCVIWAKEHFLEEIKKFKAEKYETNENLIADEDDTLSDKLLDDFINKKCLCENGVKVESGKLMTFKKNIQKILRRDKIEFKKEDIEIINLIYYCSIVRADSFRVETQSLFDTKQILCDLTQTLCTTNSIVASFMVKSASEKCNYYVLKSHELFLRSDLSEKNRNCVICGKKNYIITCFPGILLKSVIGCIEKIIGGVNKIYSIETMIYDQLNDKINENDIFMIKNNEYFFVDTKNETVFVYCLCKDTYLLNFKLLD